jgi:hypothetical protein
MEYKVGDYVRILERPGAWASEFNISCPTQLSKEKFPLEGEITQLVYNCEGRKGYHPCEIANYGFSLENLVESKNIELISRPNSVNSNIEHEYLTKLFKKLKIK